MSDDQSTKLPISWSLTTLGAVSAINPSNSTTPAEDDDFVSFVPMASVQELTGIVDVSNLRQFSEVKKGFTRFRDGDLLFAKITPCMENGKVAVVRNLAQGIGCGSTEFHVIRPEKGVDADYLRYYVIQSAFRRAAKRNMQGAVGQQRVPPDFLREASLPLAPECEQKRIVARVEEQFSQIDEGERALERVQKLAEQYRRSVLKAAVTGELTRVWREQHKAKLESGEALLARILKARREVWEKSELAKMKAKSRVSSKNNWKSKYDEPTAPDIDGSGELPSGWTWASLDQLSSCLDRAIQSGPFGSNLLHSEFRSTGKLVIGIDNVREGWFSLGSQNRISEQKFLELKKYAARPRDFVITVMATIGRTCVLPDDLEPSIISKHVYRFTLNQEAVLPEFINLCVLGRPDVRSQIFGNVQGQTRPGLNKTILARIAFPLPPLGEQRQICEEIELLLSKIAPLKSGLKDQGGRTLALRQAVLKHAFTGKLSSQDATDEPASALLERIAAERARTQKHPAPAKGRRKKVTA